MAEQTGEEGDHRPGHAGHLDQQAEEHEQRHRQQDQVRHALVDAPDDDHQRRAGGQRQIAEDAQAEGEGDRDAGEDAAGRDADEEDQQVRPAQVFEQRGGEPEGADDGDDDGRGRDQFPAAACLRQAQRRERRHQPDARGQRGGAPGIGDLQGRRGDRPFLQGIFPGRPGNHHQEGQAGAGGHGFQQGPLLAPGTGQERRHAHVLAAAQGHRRAEHGQPEEQDGGQLVRPDQRAVQDETCDHAREQHGDVGQHQECRRHFHQQAERGLQAGEFGQMGQIGHANLPVLRSSKAQASSPYLAFHSA